MIHRGMLSVISSIYDPFGFVAPCTLKWKKLLQQFCHDEVDWDQTAPDKIIKEQQMLCNTLQGRSFMRVANCVGAIHCNFIMGKARVSPKKYISIPHLELVAATLSVKMAKFIKKELNIDCPKKHFDLITKWYLDIAEIQQRSSRYLLPTETHKISEVNQWRYVPSKDNPADHASHGLIDANSGGKCSTWANGSQFLWEPEHTWSVEKDVQMVSDTDVEVKYSFKVNPVSNVNLINALEKTS